MQILNDGTMDYCRWNFESDQFQSNLTDQDPEQFFKRTTAPIRQQLLNGIAPSGCRSCHQMEQYQKVSGRQKQLLKTGVNLLKFVPSMQSSPWKTEFAKSSNNSGQTDLLPQDWQIHLGNFCNSGCLFCVPEASSRLAQEYLRLGYIDRLPPANWSTDPTQLEKLLSTLAKSPLRYLHFIGGETIITPVFRIILQHLIDQGHNHKIALGFTTNLTVWDQSIVDLLTQFDTVHLGVSVECFTPVNDYARWPSKINQVELLLEQWLAVARANNWYLQLRTTPTVLTVGDLTTVYDWAWDHNVPVESCNFLDQPAHLRPTVLPHDFRRPIIDSMMSWISQRETNDNTQVINTRNPNTVQIQLTQDLSSYCQYLKNAPEETEKLSRLANYLRDTDNNRGHSVFDYLPQYEQLLRTAGY